jgi:signal peptidase I
LLLAGAAFLSISVATGWLHITPVLSGSMRGAFNPGDALLTQRVSPTSLHVGEVIDANVPARDGLPAMQRVHRIVGLKHVGSTVVIRTKGDANPGIDPGNIVLRGDQYVMRARLPYVGWIVDFKADGGVRLLFFAIVALGVVSGGQYLWLARRSKRGRMGRHRAAPSKAIAS